MPLVIPSKRPTFLKHTNTDTGGHLHDGGTSVSLSVNGKHYCTSKAIYGGEGGSLNLNGKKWETISKMTECNDPIPVNAGDMIKIEGTYDTKNHPL